MLILFADLKKCFIFEQMILAKVLKLAYKIS
jgi:hypothetical protein